MQKERVGPWWKAHGSRLGNNAFDSDFLGPISIYFHAWSYTGQGILETCFVGQRNGWLSPGW